MDSIKIDPALVGQNISAIRKRKNIKASDIAKRIQMSESNYTKYERGEICMTLEFLNQVAENFKVRALDLITSTPDNIFENIYKSNSSAGYSNELNQEVISTLNDQIHIKDEQINKLLLIVNNQIN